MLSIRFLRVGKKHQPSYKIVVVEKQRSSKSGKFIEQLGFYNPITKEKGINKERAQYWLSQGAQPSDTLHNLLVKEGIIEAKKIAVHSTKKKKKEEPLKEEPKEEVAKKEEVQEEEPKEEPKKALQKAAPAERPPAEAPKKKPEEGEKEEPEQK